MDIDPIAVIGALVLTLLGVLLTGPGLWSEKWGWWMLHRRKRERATPRVRRRAQRPRMGCPNVNSTRWPSGSRSIVT